MIELSVADQLLDAVDILVDKATSGLQFNKTIRGKISEVIDASIGQYKIQYQNSYFTAYSADSNATYQKGSEVYVEILSSDFEKNALILGTVRRLGSNYITIIEQLDRYAEVGAKLTGENNTIELCSYEPQSVPVNLNLDPIAVREAAAAADSLKIAMKVKTALPSDQRAGGGNYGLKVIAEYYDAALTDTAKASEPTVLREYIFDINNMVGQPYKYSIATDQYAIFPIDTENFIQIVSISAFDENFPITEEGHESDIFLSDIHLQFLKALTEEELQSTALKITTPLGNYFSVDNVGDKRLHADLRVKGKKVNYDVQPVDFYWFRRNLAVNSSHEKFSSYGGNGWECLNKAGGGAFLPDTYNYTLSIDLCPAKETYFKCVAVFLDNGTSIAVSDTIIFKNLTQEANLYISSTSGTNFSFNMGKTTLKLNGYTATEYTKYCWTESIDGGAAVYYDGVQWRDNDEIDVSIETPAATLLTYECSVYEGDELQGTAVITLINNHESLGYTLVIKDGQQIFKYDSYGVSPAAQSKAAADRMTIPALSFDIYDRQGQLINIEDSEKIKYMTMRWVWPTDVDKAWSESKSKKETMLSTQEDMSVVSIRDIANNRSSQVFALVNKPTFTYSIIDRYNAVYANTENSRNNIRLEVEYQGEYLSATTNFTFTKEGELGTNGTKYVARIEPIGYEEIFLGKSANDTDQLFGLVKTATGFNIQQINLDGGKNLNTLFSAQLWDGSSNVATAANITWSIATSTTRSKLASRLTISSNNVTINTNGTNLSNIIQATIKYDTKQYYATYPIRYIDQISDNKYLWMIDGYTEVMYESDGTRGRFNPLPFRPKWLTTAGYSDVENPDNTVWASSWGAPAELVQNTIDQFTIEPPSNYIGETVGHYIKLTYNGINSYLPIELYLNRYGMSAMNDWDGVGIQVNDDGGYILAPQVGAGRKETDNSFTGITIGEVFQDQNNKEIGMFGYYKGQRSLFLDAETGDAEFGIASEGQIKIRASDGQGTISDGHYHYNHNNPSDPEPGRGLKIKFTSTPKDPLDPNDELGPYIKYGSGNFMVDANGHITAQGGGSIAGWNITDNYLQSPDQHTTLYSDNGVAEALIPNDNAEAYTGRKWSDTRKLRFDINNRFKVDEDGAIKSTAGLIGGWKIGQETLMSKDGKMYLNSSNSDNYKLNNQPIRLNIENNLLALHDGTLLGKAANYTFTPNKRIWEITPQGVAYFTDIKIKNKNAALHGNETYDSNNFTWYGNDGHGNYPKIFELTDTGSNIGGWNITGDALSSKTVQINSQGHGPGGSVISVNNALKIYGSGNLDTSGSINAGGTLNATGGGTIGGASFGAGAGGAVNFPAGVMQFGGKTVTLGTVAAVTGFTNARVTVNKDVITYVTSVSGGGESAVSASTASSTIVTGVEITLSWQGKEYTAMTNVDYGQAPLLGPYQIF